MHLKAVDDLLYLISEKEAIGNFPSQVHDLIVSNCSIRSRQRMIIFEHNPDLNSSNTSLGNSLMFVRADHNQFLNSKEDIDYHRFVERKPVLKVLVCTH